MSSVSHNRVFMKRLAGKRWNKTCVNLSCAVRELCDADTFYNGNKMHLSVKKNKINKIKKAKINIIRPMKDPAVCIAACKNIKGILTRAPPKNGGQLMFITAGRSHTLERASSGSGSGRCRHVRLFPSAPGGFLCSSGRPTSWRWIKAAFRVGKLRWNGFLPEDMEAKWGLLDPRLEREELRSPPAQNPVPPS